jgi:hypothetical protein
VRLAWAAGKRGLGRARASAHWHERGRGGLARSSQGLIRHRGGVTYTTHARRFTAPWPLILVLLGACEMDHGSNGDAATTMIPDTGDTDATTTADTDDTEAEPAGGACNAEVAIGLFATDACEGEPLLTITFPIDRPCSGWNHGERENSASRFQCYRDRLCYTQYVSSGTCDADEAKLVSDKESWTTCTKDPTPSIYTRILSGTEGCPEAPMGFACPLSGSGDGTTELAAACPG